MTSICVFVGGLVISGAVFVVVSVVVSVVSVVVFAVIFVAAFTAFTAFIRVFFLCGAFANGVIVEIKVSFGEFTGESTGESIGSFTTLPGLPGGCLRGAFAVG